MNLLKITEQEWQDAYRFFEANKEAVKLCKKKERTRYSFIKFKDKIIAIGYYLGEGTFGVVKVAEERSGKNYAIKAEGGPISRADIEENDILTQLGLSYGMIERELDKPKMFIPDSDVMRFESKKKKYKLHELLDGNDLIFELYDRFAYENLSRLVPLNKLTPTQKLIIAIKCCQLLKVLQYLRIIHADLKPENIRVHVQGNKIVVFFMDFGFSMRLDTGKDFRKDVIKGSGKYMAPEIYNPDEPSLSQRRFSLESDVYAMGVLFKDDLELEPSLYAGMVKDNPLERENVDNTIQKLVCALEKCPDLDIDATTLIAKTKKISKAPHAKTGAAAADPATSTAATESAAIAAKGVTPPIRQRALPPTPVAVGVPVTVPLTTKGQVVGAQMPKPTPEQPQAIVTARCQDEENLTSTAQARPVVTAFTIQRAQTDTAPKAKNYGGVPTPLLLALGKK